MPLLRLVWILVVFCAGMTIHSGCTVVSKDYIVDDNFSDERQPGSIGFGQNNSNLADVLRKNSNLRVEGNYPNISVSVRGMTSIVGDTSPMYVIDGVPIGRSFQSADNAVDITKIKRIRIIRSLSELAIYGEDGNNGIIRIDHTSANN